LFGPLGYYKKKGKGRCVNPRAKGTASGNSGVWGNCGCKDGRKKIPMDHSEQNYILKESGCQFGPKWGKGEGKGKRQMGRKKGGLRRAREKSRYDPLH